MCICLFSFFKLWTICFLKKRILLRSSLFSCLQHNTYINSHLINACWRTVSHRKMIKTENWLSSPVDSFWQIGYSSITFMSSLDYNFQRCERAAGSSMDPEPGPSMSDTSEAAAPSATSISCCWWSFSSAISHLIPLLQSVTLPACPFNTRSCRSAVVLY